MVVVRFDTPRYAGKGANRGKRKASIFSDKSHAKKLEGGRKIAVAFKTINGERPNAKTKRRKRR